MQTHARITMVKLNPLYVSVDLTPRLNDKNASDTTRPKKVCN
jgi:hypothetical protein